VSRPFFTIAIPSKNRPERVGDAVRSVVEQTFPDLELIVCDNSDEAHAAKAAAVVAAFEDPRVRYIRTSGQLSMPDNWERAIADASGDYVGILTDRSVFRRDALEVVRRDIEATGAQLVTWLNDLYGRGPAGTDYRRRACTLERYGHESRTLLDYFLHGDPRYSTKVVPKLMTSVCHRSILEAIRASPVGRCCPPVAPDFTSGFLMLAHSDRVLTIDEALYVSCGKGTGWDFRHAGELAARFRRDLGIEPHELVDRMPSEARFSHALVLNDLMRIAEAIPERLAEVEVDMPQYYLGCLDDFVKAARNGARSDEDRAALLDALEREPVEVRKLVEGSELYRRAGRAQIAAARMLDKVAAVVTPHPPGFATVFDAMAWDEASPRKPSATSFVSLHHGLAELLTEPRAARRPGLRGLLGRARGSLGSGRGRRASEPLVRGALRTGEQDQCDRERDRQQPHGDQDRRRVR